MPQPTNYHIAALAASQRAERAPALRPFRSNIGGPFRAAQPIPGPCDRAQRDASERVAQAQREAETVRRAWERFERRATYRPA